MSASDNTIRVVGFTADKNQVILYKDDGDTVTLNQGDHRLRDLLDAILPITSKQGVAEIRLDTFNVYGRFQEQAEKAGGFTRMFKVAKSALSKVFGSKENEPAQISANSALAIRDALNAPTPTPEPEASPSLVPAPAVTHAEALKADLQPVTDETTLNDHETLVAVTKNGDVVPGVEAIKPLLQHAVKHNSTIGVENFLARAGKMMDKRQHSVEDLLRFLEKGDLPLAEDGSIIAYKVLRYHTYQKETFVDCHTRKIPQKVGSYVRVDESLVDLNRHNECSNGLHIARRGYIHGFSGDLCVLCKIDPEDVVTVPHRDPDKVRVMGYHILGKLSQQAWNELKVNRPITSDKEAVKLLADALKGVHVPRLEEVRVTRQLGEGIVITPLTTAGTPKAEADASVAVAVEAIEEAQAAPPVEPREINKRISAQMEAMAEEVEQELNQIGGEESKSNPWNAAEAAGYEVVEEFENEEDGGDSFWTVYTPNGDALLETFASEDLAWADAVRHMNEQAEQDAKLGMPIVGTTFEEKAADEADRIRNAMNTGTPHTEALKPEPVESKEDKARRLKQERDRKYREKKAAEKRQAKAAARKAAEKKTLVDPAPKPKGKPVVEKKKPTKGGHPSPAKVMSTQTISKNPTKAEEARGYFTKWQSTGKADDFLALLEFKQRVKKGWAILGFTDEEQLAILYAIDESRKTK